MQKEAAEMGSKAAETAHKSPIETEAVQKSPLEVYEALLEAGTIEADQHQTEVVRHLEELYGQVGHYTPSPPGPLSRWLGLKGAPAPLGLYLWGTVGTGKTMLMDLFYDTVPLQRKMRVHFHSFMLDVHSRVHAHKASVARVTASDQARYFDPSGTYTLRSRPVDAIAPVAKQIAEKASLVCFDEFQVTDIADAMILKRLFTALFEVGVVVVATSNRPPRDLYKNGLQRSQFMPFIPILQEHVKVLHIDSGIDYRGLRQGDSNTFFVKADCDADTELETVFKVLCSEETDSVRPRTFTYHGRNLTIGRACGHVADCSFAELCEQSLAAMDYLQLSQQFHTILIRDIPVLTEHKKSAARRFITLIDTLYDNKVRVVCSSEVPHTQIFKRYDSRIITKENLLLMDDLGLKEASTETKAINIFTGEEEQFACDRTVSRLSEMMTSQYWQAYLGVQR